MILGKLWKSFRDLTSDPAPQIATVISSDSGKYTVTFRNGNSADVFSDKTYNVNDQVFVVGDKIDSKAPNMDYAEIDV